MLKTNFSNWIISHPGRLVDIIILYLFFQFNKSQYTLVCWWIRFLSYISWKWFSNQNSKQNRNLKRAMKNSGRAFGIGILVGDGIDVPDRVGNNWLEMGLKIHFFQLHSFIYINPSVPDRFICVGARLRQFGELRPLRRDCARLWDRRMSCAVSKGSAEVFLSDNAAWRSVKYYVPQNSKKFVQWFFSNFTI